MVRETHHDDRAHRIELARAINDTTHGKISELVASPTSDGVLMLAGFHSIGDGGGGIFYWDASENKANHDGGTIIDPDNAADLDTWDASAQTTWFTAGSGTGCWKRQKESSGYTVRHFGAKGDGTTDDAKPIQQAFDKAATVNDRRVIFGPGDFSIEAIITIDTGTLSIIGMETAQRQTGSTAIGCTLIWNGGSTEMFSADQSQLYFKGFSVGNKGTAQEWLELESGAINNIYEDLSFVLASGYTEFSRAIIRGNSNVIGYSQFRNIYMKAASPVFLEIDGNASSNGCTPISFTDRCIFASASANPVTVINVIDELIEGISIVDCSFIQNTGLLKIFDSTTDAAAVVCNCFVFSNNEIDSSGDATADRFFEFKNVDNIIFDGNTINGGGNATYIGTLTNSNLVSCNGNNMSSIVTAYFDADSDSLVKAGVNLGGGRPVAISATAVILRPTYAASMSIDCRPFSGQKHELIEIEVTDANAYTINLDTSVPQYVEYGQVFSVIIKNISGGAINAGAFGSAFNTQGALTAPADTKNRAYTFYFNGTKAIEISRVTADVAN